MLYGSHHFYVLLRQIYTIYERILKAKQIIEQKVDEDLALKEDELLKKKAPDFKNEKFEVFLAGATLALQAGFDTNRYEDFIRALLGGKAYLLFSFEKLISAVRLLR